MKRLLLVICCCGSVLAGQLEHAFAADGEKIYGRCARCHGDTADQPPHVLKGQDPAVLLEKLRGYEEGTYGGDRKKVMTNMAKSLSGEEKEAVVKHIGTL